ncbi:hypothetical protein N7532_007429 [Penicillium argentinense]|uniref:Uncharacterized protein n=1 Tax=Penicillium argentinense TaxID=1131581 RepID=A0A9W9F7R1_9EURO|nr:uncharacterized protein N7532_007429 [Penicillium argentinense]KAJ5095138.1 hypothetical protein N7532_007429 [Penicillium argentinense]
MKPSTVFSAFVTLALATAIPVSEPETGTEVDNTLTRRDPSDESGNSQFVLQCEGETLPAPGGASGEGEGGSSYFDKNLLFNAQGAKIEPEACTSDGSTCSNCLFSGGGLSSPTNVTGCWNPPGGQRGCQLSFKYNGYDYDTEKGESKCGHLSGFKPFAFDLSAVCYFDV